MDEILNIDFHVKQMVLVALNTCCCHEGAARKLGIDVRTLHRKKKQYGIQKNWREGRYHYEIIKRPLRSVA